MFSESLIRRRFRSRLRQRRLFLEPLENRRVLAGGLSLEIRPLKLPLDASGDGVVAPLDALLVVNELNRGGFRALGAASESADSGPAACDANRDGWLSPLDVLVIVNALSVDQSPPAISAQVAGSGEPQVISSPNGLEFELSLDGVVTGTVTDDWTGVQWLAAQVDLGEPIPVVWDESGAFRFDPGLPRDGTANGEHSVRLTAADGLGQRHVVDLEFRVGLMAPTFGWQEGLVFDPRLAGGGTAGLSSPTAGSVHADGEAGVPLIDFKPIINPAVDAFVTDFRCDATTCFIDSRILNKDQSTPLILLEYEVPPVVPDDAPPAYRGLPNPDGLTGPYVKTPGPYVIPPDAYPDLTPVPNLPPGEYLRKDFTWEIGFRYGDPDRFTFFVNVLGVLPECTLRAAIEEANARPGSNTIVFNVPGDISVNSKGDASDTNPGDGLCYTGNPIAPGPRSGRWTIQPASALPAIVDTVLLDGTTQPGFSGTPIVELDGSRIGTSANGLVVSTRENTVVKGMVINRFPGNGILVLEGANHTRIEGNYIGTDVAGTSATVGNAADGVVLVSFSNTIGGSSDRLRNVISGNAGNGVAINGPSSKNNVMEGNYIGTDFTGQLDVGNGLNGIRVQASAKNTIGGRDVGAGNVISGNQRNGIHLSDVESTANWVLGNYIGTKVTGTDALRNEGNGVLIENWANANRIGTDGDTYADAAEGNVISGNKLDGVHIEGDRTDKNIVAGNWIGTDKAGVALLPNLGDGVEIAGKAKANRIGTDGNGIADEADGNVISGNGEVGVYLVGEGTEQNIAAGNWIGTNKAGDRALPNQLHGVMIDAKAKSNWIGTNGDGNGDAAEANLISGNKSVGVFITGEGTDRNIVAGNLIGTDRTGVAALPNEKMGVQIAGKAKNNWIGTNGTGNAFDAAEANVISGNKSVGVFITGEGTDRNIVAGNLIGTNKAGTGKLPNEGDGVQIGNGAKANRIGTDGNKSADTVETNVISGNKGRGVSVLGAGTNDNIVAGNLIGTNKAGTGKLPNEDRGVLIQNGARANRIGTDGNGTADAAERNVISGNLREGVWITGTDTRENIVSGNYVGVDISGTRGLGNGHGGVAISSGAHHNTVGTNGDDSAGDAVEGNVISGNQLDGVRISGMFSDGNVVAGNRIGVDKNGTGLIPNRGSGVVINGGAQQNRVGTDADGRSDAAESNLISGNLLDGVRLGHSAAFALGNPADDFDIDSTVDFDGPPLSDEERRQLQNVVDDAKARITRVIRGDLPNATAADGTPVDDILINVHFIPIGGTTLGRAEATELRPGSNLPLRGYVDIDIAYAKAALGDAAKTRRLLDTITHEMLHVLGYATIWDQLGLVTGAGGNDPQYTGSAGAAKFSVQTGLPETSVPIENEGEVGDGSRDVHVREKATNDELMSTFSDPASALSILTLGFMEDLGFVVDYSQAEPYALPADYAKHAGVSVVARPTSNNRVAGNLIGTDITGTVDRGNAQNGVHVANASDNFIGGKAATQGNIISGNDGHGVAIGGTASTGNRVQGNLIGTRKLGAVALANSKDGVFIDSGAVANVVGTDGDGTADADEGNVISGNTQHGVRIAGVGTNVNRVAGNRIGTNLAGNGKVPNTLNGVMIEGKAFGNIVGTNGDGNGDGGEGNLISGNTRHGVQITGAATNGHRVAGNRIGTNLAGNNALSNTLNGVLIDNAASGNYVGTNGDGNGDEAEGNLISGNLKQGVQISGKGTVSNVVAGNKIGTNLAGNGKLPNTLNGVLIDGGAQLNQIGAATHENIIGGNTQHGVVISGAGTSVNRVQNNLIGSDGVLGASNTRQGVRVELGATLNQIGVDPNGIGAGNDISRNTLEGVAITGAGTNDNFVAGNLIDRNGGQGGVLIELRAQKNTIGTDGNGKGDLLEGNLITLSQGNGVTIVNPGTDGNRVTRNEITRNSGSGVRIAGGAQQNKVGSDSDGSAGDGNEANLIAGNILYGVLISGAQTRLNRVDNNLIGFDGAAGAPNVRQGVRVEASASANVIGRDKLGIGFGNDISGNTAEGVALTGAGTNDNFVAGNLIDRNGGQGGVLIDFNAQQNTIGTNGDGKGDVAEANLITSNKGHGVIISGANRNPVAGNTIADNKGNGVTVIGAAIGNTITRNSIFINQKLGIDLGNNGVTNNDFLDADAGPNNLQNFPVLTSVQQLGGGVVNVQGTLSSVAGQQYRIEFFWNAALDPSGHGEGAQYLGDVNIPAGPHPASFNVFLFPVPAGGFITATATRIATGDTSEFSGRIPVNGGAAVYVVNSTADLGDKTPGDGICWTGGTILREVAGIPGLRVPEPECTLRAVLEEGNARALAGPILFNIPTLDPGFDAAAGVFTISPQTALPRVVNPIWLDAYTQPGALLNDLALEQGTNAVLKVELDGKLVAGNGKFGDADGNGTVGIDDVNQVVDWILGRDPMPLPGDLPFVLSDVDGSGSISDVDLNWIVDFLLGRIEKFPVGLVNDANGLNIAAGNSFISGLAIQNFANSAIQLSGAGGNVVEGNFLGTDAAGTSAAGNLNGVQIFRSANNLIGGPLPESRNLISGNRFEGVFIFGEQSVHNEVQGNLIGVDAFMQALGNLGSGVAIERASDNTVGGTASGAGNVIAFNGTTPAPVSTAGVAVTLGSGNAILANSIFSNVGLGIDLNRDGPSLNDALDPDAGPNGLQNFPVLSSATTNGTSVRVIGVLNSTAGQAFRVEFFASEIGDPSGFGEGELLIGSVQVVTAGDGNALFDVTFAFDVLPGERITATATRLSTGDTSEFSATRIVV